MDVHSRIRRTILLLIPAAFAARSAPAQDVFPPQNSQPQNPQPPEDIRLPNGKKQQDEILKADYQKNLKDAQEMTSIARSFEEDLEKNEQYVYSLSQLKKLDDIEKLTKRIRSRLKRY